MPLFEHVTPYTRGWVNCGDLKNYSLKKNISRIQSSTTTKYTFGNTNLQWCDS